MKIQIESRKVLVDENEFYEVIKNFCIIYKKMYPKCVRCYFKDITKEYKIKLTDVEFYEICSKLNIETFENMVDFKSFGL